MKKKEKEEKREDLFSFFSWSRREEDGAPRALESPLMRNSVEGSQRLATMDLRIHS